MTSGRRAATNAGVRARLADRLCGISPAATRGGAPIAVGRAGLTFFAAAVAFLRPPPQATAAVKNPDHIGRVVGSGPMLERDTVLDLALESAMPAVGAYERLVAQAYEQALVDADADALPVSAVAR